MRLWLYPFRGLLRSALVSVSVRFRANPALDVNFMFDVQVTTHLKGLADKAKLNEKHVKIARIYKAKATSLSSERGELQERALMNTHLSDNYNRI